MQARFDAGTSEEEYLGFIRGKTVALFLAAFRIAGIECGVSDHMLEQLTELGICFGYAFQLRDDLKDYVSKTEDEGKAVHADIRAGYYTMPLLHALQTKAGTEIRTLLETAQNGTDPEAEAALSRVMSLVNETDAFSYTAERIKAYGTRGLALLHACPGTEAKNLIEEVMQWLITATV